MKKELTQLDNDFITVWSYYLLTDSLSGKGVAIKQLAKMGQPNAIQAWYQFNDIGTCPAIDKKLAELEQRDSSFEVVYASACREKADRDQQLAFRSLIKRMSKVISDYNETCQITKEQFDQEVQSIKTAIENIPFVAKQTEATALALSTAKKSGDLIEKERANELYFSQAPYCLTDKQRDSLRQKVEKNNKNIVAQLYLKIEENLSTDKSWNATNDPELTFTFAKAIKLFKEFNKSPRLDNIATKILGTLSQRELSEELLDAIYNEENVNF